MNASLTAAQVARTDAILDRAYRDRVTGGTYTHRARFNAGAYMARTMHVEAGKPDTYGLILASETDGPISYMTPVIPVAKLIFDHAAYLPVIEFDEDHCTIHRHITDAEWSHLTGVNA